ncbi:MAG: hypothetical protein HKN87_15035 [Saprospiraceae bacterium]|nr:hypothetical protein [Saprospiraceae bacterium]
MAHLAKTKGRYAEAQTQLDQACSIIPEVGFYITKTEICLEAGGEEQAQGITDEVLNMLADDINNGHNMDLEYAHVYWKLREDPKSALKYLERSYTSRPDNIDINRAMARLYLQTERT